MSVGLDYRPALLSSTGIARSVRELARALATLEGIDLHLFGHSFSRARRSELPLGSAHLHRLPIPGRLLPTLAKLGLGSERLCGSVPLFHLTDYVHPPLGDTRSLLTLHDLAFIEAPDLHGEASSAQMLARTRKASEIAQFCICPSRATADVARSRLNIDPSRLRVIPFGVDHIRNAAAADPLGGRPFLLVLGTIEPRKNHLRLLQAWRQLGRQRPLLVVIGARGWLCEEAVACLEQEVAGGLLRWHQQADDSVVYAHLSHARALLYPSLLEGFGFPPLEALSLGTPVLAGDTPALRESLADAAWFCHPRSVEDIGEVLARMLEDQQERDRKVLVGRERAAGFTWRACAERHLAVYREALA